MKKGKKRTVTCYMPHETYGRIQAEALTETRYPTQMILVLIEEALAAREKWRELANKCQPQ